MILYILANNNSVFTFYLQKRIRPYAILTILCALFSFIYTKFSHGVTSPHMSYLFLYPLCFGVLCGLLCGIWKHTITNFFFATHFYHTGVIALILSSLLKGVFEIAGTTSIYQTILTGIGVTMISISIITYVLYTDSNRKF